MTLPAVFIDLPIEPFIELARKLANVSEGV